MIHCLSGRVLKPEILDTLPLSQARASLQTRSNIATEVPDAAVNSGAVPGRRPVSLPSRPLPGP